jgi:hypothetical protein
VTVRGGSMQSVTTAAGGDYGYDEVHRDLPRGTGEPAEGTPPPPPPQDPGGDHGYDEAHDFRR